MGIRRVSDTEHLRIVAIIQARMGSTRLPGKVLKPIAGQPLLWHIVHRLKKSKLIADVAVATTTNPLDDAIVEFGREHGVTIIRGPEDDVLQRFALAAEATDADVIVRVSSDAPFIDAGFVDHLLTAMLAQDGDFVLMADGATTAHEGVDPLTRRGLDKLMMDASADPVAREHVTGYFKLHPDFVSIARAPAYPELAREGGRLTIDTPDDLAFIEAVHARMDAKAGEASLADILLLLEREPALRGINAHVKQKEIVAKGGLALIRCDGGGRFGYGHVKRMTALARALRDREGIGSVFAVNGSSDACDPIRRAGFAATLLGDETLESMVETHAPDLLLLDGREGPSRAELADLAPHVRLTAVVDDASERRLAADLAYYPPVPQAQALDWSGSRCEPRIGWEWSLLGSSQIAIQPRPQTGRPTLLVTMGGSDPFGLTLRSARALARLDPVFRARFVIGPGMTDRERVARQIVALHSNFETIEGAEDLAPEFARADVALAAFGVTAYELAAFGVPALYLCLTEDHALSASAFEHAGIGLSLGVAEAASDETVASSVLALLNDAPRRREMRAAGLMTIDGQGPARIAADLAKALAAARRQGRSKPLGNPRQRLVERRRPIAARVRHHQFTRRRERLVRLRKSRPARIVENLVGIDAGTCRQPRHRRRRRDHRIQRRQHRRGAVQFVLLVEILQLHDAALSHLRQFLDLVVAGVVLHAHHRPRQPCDEIRPRLARRVLQGAMTGGFAAAPAHADERRRTDAREQPAPARHLARIGLQKRIGFGKGVDRTAQNLRQAAHLDERVRAAGRLQPAITRPRDPAARLQVPAMHRHARKRALEQRYQPRIAFQHHAAAVRRRARRQIGDHAGEHDLVADALLGGDEQPRPLQRPAAPAGQRMLRHRHLARDLQPRGIVPPAVLQVPVQQMQHRAVQPRLRIVRFALFTARSTAPAPLPSRRDPSAGPPGCPALRHNRASTPAPRDNVPRRGP